MKTKEKEQVVTKDLRETLKGIMQNEIEKLPEYLDGLEPKEKLNVICKLMPYVFPKVQTVSSSQGEPLNTSFW
jgi:hypothetical protein